MMKTMRFLKQPIVFFLLISNIFIIESAFCSADDADTRPTSLWTRIKLGAGDPEADASTFQDNKAPRISDVQVKVITEADFAGVADGSTIGNWTYWRDYGDVEYYLGILYLPKTSSSTNIYCEAEQWAVMPQDGDIEGDGGSKALRTALRFADENSERGSNKAAGAHAAKMIPILYHLFVPKDDADKKGVTSMFPGSKGFRFTELRTAHGISGGMNVQGRGRIVIAPDYSRSGDMLTPEKPSNAGSNSSIGDQLATSKYSEGFWCMKTHQLATSILGPDAADANMMAMSIGTTQLLAGMSLEGLGIFSEPLTPPSRIIMEDPALILRSLTLLRDAGWLKTVPIIFVTSKDDRFTPKAQLIALLDEIYPGWKEAGNIQIISTKGAHDTRGLPFDMPHHAAGAFEISKGTSYVGLSACVTDLSACLPAVLPAGTAGITKEKFLEMVVGAGIGEVVEHNEYDQAGKTELEGKITAARAAGKLDRFSMTDGDAMLNLRESILALGNDADEDLIHVVVRAFRMRNFLKIDHFGLEMMRKQLLARQSAATDAALIKALDGNIAAFERAMREVIVMMSGMGAADSKIGEGWNISKSLPEMECLLGNVTMSGFTRAFPCGVTLGASSAAAAKHAVDRSARLALGMPAKRAIIEITDDWNIHTDDTIEVGEGASGYYVN